MYVPSPNSAIMKSHILASSSLHFLLHLLSVASATDTIKPGQLIPDDGHTIVSSTHTFELGFFSPAASTKRYVGIWYKDIAVRTPVWVANRESPLTKNGTSPGVLTVTPSGQLVILDGSDNKTIWSSNTTGVARNPVVQLLESGNMVIREANDVRPENYLWQTFDHPTDTLLPGMRISWNPVKGRGNYLSQWRTYEDPAPGDSTIGFFDITGYPQVAITRVGAVLYRLGPWNGIQFNSKQKPVFTAGLLRNDSVVYYRPDTTDKSVVSRFTLSPIGVGQHWTWVRNQSEDWVFSYSFPADLCDTYRLCGAHALCNPDKNPVCGCLGRFMPKIKAGWVKNDWSGGCIRRASLNCATDVFYSYSGVRLPYSQVTLYNGSSNLEECKAVCLGNCTCMAYSFVRSGVSGCMLWFGDLLDLRRIQGAKQKIYIRMSVSELDSDRLKRTKLIAVSTSCAGIVLLSVSVALFVWKQKKDKERRRKAGFDSDQDFELPMYDLSTVIKATKNFSDDNKLGEGGFGPVYKGMLENGMEVAVKRLSESSSQGPDEFKNEVICIAKLQHRNLVKLLGCCIQGHEKILLYEYMPNKSLDLVLYDKIKGMQLDWSKRFHIINGVARGILYLHQDSQLRIIHRDLKASNVLLDNDLNPKISDFGMARIFGGNETEAQTRRVVGTYGYMSPEYAGEGLFSIKSDVYSFGVLVLEIVSGQRNRGFQHEDHSHNLIGHAWILYKEGMSLELVDPNILSSVTLNELLRSIHVALLCVQQCPEDRPNMASVVLMLGSGGALPEARKPGFFTERHVVGTGRTTSTNAERPSNEYTITLLAPR